MYICFEISSTLSDGTSKTFWSFQYLIKGLSLQCKYAPIGLW